MDQQRLQHARRRLARAHLLLLTALRDAPDLASLVAYRERLGWHLLELRRLGDVLRAERRPRGTGTPCRHAAVVQTQRAACGELEALGVPWRVSARCPDCGRLIELVWEAARCTVWEHRPSGIVFLREDDAPATEPPPTDV